MSQNNSTQLLLTTDLKENRKKVLTWPHKTQIVQKQLAIYKTLAHMQHTSYQIFD
jgi:hypothetical protein